MSDPTPPDFEDSETFEVHTAQSGHYDTAPSADGGDGGEEGGYDNEQFDELSYSSPKAVTATGTGAGAAARPKSQPASLFVSPKRRVVALATGPTAQASDDPDSADESSKPITAAGEEATSAPVTTTAATGAAAESGGPTARTFRGAHSASAARARKPLVIAGAIPQSENWMRDRANEKAAAIESLIASTASSTAKQTAKPAAAALTKREQRESNWDSDFSTVATSGRVLPAAPQTVNPSRVRSTIDTKMNAAVLRKLSSAKPMIERERKQRAAAAAQKAKAAKRATAPAIASGSKFVLGPTAPPSAVVKPAGTTGGSAGTGSGGGASATIAALAPTLSAIASGPLPKRGSGLRPPAPVVSAAAATDSKKIAALERELAALKRRMGASGTKSQPQPKPIPKTFNTLTDPAHLRVALSTTPASAHAAITQPVANTPAAADESVLSPPAGGALTSSNASPRRPVVRSAEFPARTAYCMHRRR